MQVSFWWDNGDIEEWDSTYLSFHDGVILQGGRLLLSDVEEKGVIYRPRYVNDNAHKKDLIGEDIVLVAPEDVPHLLRMERNGWTVLQADKDGNLINVALREATEGKQLEQMPAPDFLSLYHFDPETGEMLDDEGEEYTPDLVTAWIDEAFEGLTS